MVTSEQIETRLASLYERLRLPEGRLELMSGIRERRFWPPGVLPGQMSVETGRRALEISGVDRREVGALVHGSVCRDYLEPATAAGVHHGLDLPAECILYDVSNACLGLLNGMIQVANMIELGQIRAGLVVGTESSRGLVEATIAQLNADESLTRKEIKPAFGGLTEKGAEQGALFRTRLLKRARHLRRWPTRRGITCFRVYERDIPEIPLVVDRYEDCLHVTEYERPHDRTPAEHADWLDLIARTAANALEVDPKRVFLKRRQRQRGKKQHERLAEENRTFIVHEGGLKFEVNLSDYVDTGLFLDHRQTRGMVRDQAGGKRFLNLFAYTGAFSVYAAAGGASETTTVDWSNTYLDWARRNMVLNGFTGANHRFVRADARTFLDEDRREYDLAVVDPPTFSNRGTTLSPPTTKSRGSLHLHIWEKPE